MLDEVFVRDNVRSAAPIKLEHPSEAVVYATAPPSASVPCNGGGLRLDDIGVSNTAQVPRVVQELVHQPVPQRGCQGDEAHESRDQHSGGPTFPCHYGQPRRVGHVQSQTEISLQSAHRQRRGWVQEVKHACPLGLVAAVLEESTHSRH